MKNGAINGAKGRKGLKRPKGRIAALAELDMLGQSPYAGGLTPLLPSNLVDPAQYRNLWFCNRQDAIFKKARLLLKENDFFGGVHKVKKSYFNDSFRFTGDAGKQKNEWARFAEVFKAARRLAADVWHEWLAMDNAVVYWRLPEGNEGALPTIIVLDCETLEYSNILGVETLKVKLPQVKLTPEQKRQFGARWAEAYEKGKEIELKKSEGDRWKVLTRAKLGAGLGDPGLWQILAKLGTLDLLRLADWCGAWQHRNVVEHWTGGHEIRSGEQAGSKTNFLNTKQKKLIEDALKNKIGAFRAVTNFDVGLAYKYLDPAFFNAHKYDGVLGQLRQWAGAASMMYEKGTPSPTLMLAFSAEGRADRADVGLFLEEILNDPEFIGEAPPVPLTVGWNPNSFRDTKMMLEWLRLSGGQGWLSPQTAREAMDLDDDVEGDRLEEAAKTPVRYRPPFEPKQGMLTNPAGGRPQQKELPANE